MTFANAHRKDPKELIAESQKLVVIKRESDGKELIRPMFTAETLLKQKGFTLVGTYTEPKIERRTEPVAPVVTETAVPETPEPVKEEAVAESVVTTPKRGRPAKTA